MVDISASAAFDWNRCKPARAGHWNLVPVLEATGSPAEVFAAFRFPHKARHSHGFILSAHD
jgi:hypothetical protein